MDDLSVGHLKRALTASRQLAELSDLREFPAYTAAVLRDLIPCEHSGYNAIHVGSRRAKVTADPPEAVFDGGPEALALFADQNPLIVLAQGGKSNAGRLSDYISRRQLHRTDLYDNVYRVIGLEYQLAVQLPPPRPDLGRTWELVGLSLARHHRDFSDAEIQLLDLLAPHFAATLERLHELALLRALTAESAEDSARWVVLIDRRATIAWATPAAQRALSLSIGERLPPVLCRWLNDEAAPLAIDDVPVRARLVRDAYPDLDAIHITPLLSAAGPDALRSLGLTRRQADVLALALQGRATPDIAQRLSLSPRTVEKHFDAIYTKLGVTNRSGAIVAAVQALTAT